MSAALFGTRLSALPEDGDYTKTCWSCFNPSNAKLNPICHLLALLGAHHILHVSGLRVNVNFNTPFKKLVHQLV